MNQIQVKFDVWGFFIMLCWNMVMKKLKYKNKKLMPSHFGTLHAGTMKSHNICKRYVAISTPFKQTESNIFFSRYFNGIIITAAAFKYIFESKFTYSFDESMPKLS